MIFHWDYLLYPIGRLGETCLHPACSICSVLCLVCSSPFGRMLAGDQFLLFVSASAVRPKIFVG